MRMLLALMLLSAPAAAGTWGPYDEKAVDAARRGNHVVLLHFTARGCNICESQENLLSRQFWSSQRKDLSGFQVDFDQRSDLVAALRVEGRSTLILYRGAKEVARSVGMVEEIELQTFLQQADRAEPRGRLKTRPNQRRPPRP